MTLRRHYRIGRGKLLYKSVRWVLMEQKVVGVAAVEAAFLQ